MGLQPLEFSECLTDSPHFRDKLHNHEKELERTSKGIKQLIAESKELFSAAESLSKAQRKFANTLNDFQFECIGNARTDDEEQIENSFKEFSRIINGIEDQRDRMLNTAKLVVIEPLEKFRKSQIGEAKDGKRKFDKDTSRFCKSLDTYLSMKLTKQSESQLQEADNALAMERQQFYRESMQYVLRLQEVQERKKFEFVEILLQFINGWLTFYHQGYEYADDFKPFMGGLQLNLQRCRANFDLTKDEAMTLMNKMLEVRGKKPTEQCYATSKMGAREGYLYVLEKKALGTTWNKYYCQYQRSDKSLSMIPYNQVTGKTSNATTDRVCLTSCTRRAHDSIDKRFCFDITVGDRPQPITLQAMSDDDRKMWLDAMDGKEPIYQEPARNNKLDSLLDDIGFSFIKKCIAAIEARGLDEEGLYRVVGVNSKVVKLTSLLLDRRKADRVTLDEVCGEWEMKTITSALKNYFRSLPEPLMTFAFHNRLIQAAKQNLLTLRVNEIHEIVHQLPEANFEMLEVLIGHLKKVSTYSHTNLMTVSNIGVCFGPTLMRPEEETMAAIMDIKFCNLVIEILIDHYDKIFKQQPMLADINNTRVLSSVSKGQAPPPPITVPPNSVGVNSFAAVSISSPVNHASSPSSYAGGVGGGGSNSGFSTSNHVREPTLASATPPPVMTTSTSYVTTRSGLGGGGAGGGATGGGNGGQTHTDQRAGLRPASSVYGQQSSPAFTASRFGVGGSGVIGGGGVGGDRQSNASSSSESLNSKSSSSAMSMSQTTTGSVTDSQRFNQRRSQPPVNQVRPSKEPGWLEGCLDGKVGLIPHNYVEFLK